MSSGTMSAIQGGQPAAIQQAMQLAASGAPSQLAPQSPPVQAAPEPQGPTVNAQGQAIGTIINVTA